MGSLKMHPKSDVTSCWGGGKGRAAAEANDWGGFDVDTRFPGQRQNDRLKERGER